MKVLIVTGGSNGAQSLTASEIASQLRDAGDDVTLHCPRIVSTGRTRPVTYGEEEGDIEPSAHLLDVHEVSRSNVEHFHSNTHTCTSMQ